MQKSLPLNYILIALICQFFKTASRPLRSPNILDPADRAFASLPLFHQPPAALCGQRKIFCVQLLLTLYIFVVCSRCPLL